MVGEYWSSTWSQWGRILGWIVDIICESKMCGFALMSPGVTVDGGSYQPSERQEWKDLCQQLQLQRNCFIHHVRNHNNIGVHYDVFIMILHIANNCCFLFRFGHGVSSACSLGIRGTRLLKIKPKKMSISITIATLEKIIEPSHAMGPSSYVYM